MKIFTTILMVLSFSVHSYAAQFQGDPKNFKLETVKLPDGVSCGAYTAAAVNVVYKGTVIWHGLDMGCSYQSDVNEFEARIFQAKEQSSQVYFETQTNSISRSLIVVSEIHEPVVSKINSRIEDLEKRVQKLEHP